MSDLISRQDAIDAVGNMLRRKFGIGGDLASITLAGLPSAQPERKKGKWVLDENPHDGDCRCSACGIAIHQMHERNHGLLNALTNGKWWTFYKFCPNCGADMRGENNG